VFCIFALSSSAQFGGVPTKISTPYGSRTIYTPSTFKFYSKYSYGKGGVISNTRYFTVVFLNDSIMEVRGKINLDSTVSFLQWGRKEQAWSIKPFETKEIYRMAGGKKIRGIPTGDSCWLFLVDNGKIRTYSVTSEMEAPTIAYIQKGENGQMLPFTDGNVLKMIQDNERAIALAKKGKLLNAVRRYNYK
jgi:hypothetical protein